LFTNMAEDSSSPFDLSGFAAAMASLSDSERSNFLRHLGAAPIDAVADASELSFPEHESILVRYISLLKEAEARSFTVTARTEETRRILATLPDADDRAGLYHLIKYHEDLAKSYSDAVAVACLSEPSLAGVHSFHSATSLGVLKWVTAYKAARPNSKPTGKGKNRGGSRRHGGKRESSSGATSTPKPSHKKDASAPAKPKKPAAAKKLKTDP
jgi:hypothetical protein